MKPFDTIRSTIANLFPDAEMVVTPPKHEDGVWSLDIDLGDNKISVEWDRSAGFGISTVRVESYGEQPDEVYRDEVAVLARLVTLLGLKQRTAPQRPLTLTELRERRGCTQGEIAAKLGVRQPTLSANERREDVQLSTMRSFVKALGGKLETFAVFDDVCYVIDTKPGRRRSRSLAIPVTHRWFASLSAAPADEETGEDEVGRPGTLSFAIPL